MLRRNLYACTYFFRTRYMEADGKNCLTVFREPVQVGYRSSDYIYIGRVKFNWQKHVDLSAPVVCRCGCQRRCSVIASVFVQSLNFLVSALKLTDHLFHPCTTDANRSCMLNCVLYIVCYIISRRVVFRAFKTFKRKLT